MTNEKSNTADRELFMQRVIHAPRALVYKMWTAPEHMAKWWGPNGFTNTIVEMDVRTGGKSRYIMHGPDGKDYPNLMTYTDVVVNEKLVYIHGEDEDSVDANFHVTAMFEDEGEGTKISMRMVFATAEEKKRVVEEYGAEEGQMQTINRLEEYLAFYEAESTFTISRVFDAPLDLVYDVHTKIEHLVNHWGPKESNTEIKEFDFRSGGTLFYCMEMPGCKVYGKQIYREIVPYKYLTMISISCDEHGNEAPHAFSDTWPTQILNTMSFEAVDDNRTRLTVRGVPFNATEEEHESFKQGHGAIHGGYDGTFTALEEYLASLK